MAKIVYNACYGGFSLSTKAIVRGREIAGEFWGDDWGARGISRHDPTLIRVVEELGLAASGACAKLEIIELPSGAQYRIDEYDGSESVNTPESYEWEIAP